MGREKASDLLFIKWTKQSLSLPYHNMMIKNKSDFNLLHLFILAWSFSFLMKKKGQLELSSFFIVHFMQGFWEKEGVDKIRAIRFKYIDL